MTYKMKIPKVNLPELKRRINKFANEQYNYCKAKTTKQLKGKVSGEQLNLNIKHLCNNAAGVAIRKQRGICKQIKGVFNTDRLDCGRYIDDAASEYFKKGDAAEKVLKSGRK